MYVFRKFCLYYKRNTLNLSCKEIVTATKKTLVTISKAFMCEKMYYLNTK